MTNQYYNFTDAAVPGSVVDGLKYNQEMTKITVAFDNFPPPVEFTSGAINYGAQPSGQPVNTYSIPVTAIPSGTPYVAGNNVAFQVATTNTGASQLQVSNNGLRNLLIGAAGNAVAGDFRVPAIYTAVFDGTIWRTLEMSARWFGIAEVQAPLAEARRDAAMASAAAASVSEGQASASAAAAAIDASAATTSRTNATASQNSASTSASNAGASQSQANNSAAQATSAQNTAAGAATTATNAATTATNANTAAQASATHAETKNQEALASAQAAADAAAEAVNIPTAPDFADRVEAALKEMEFPVGVVELFASSVDPNTWFTGMTWVKLPPHVSLMMASADGSDILDEVGVDAITLDLDKMAAHSHVTPPRTTSAVAAIQVVTGTKTGWTASMAGVGVVAIIGPASLTPTVGTFDYGALPLPLAGDHIHQYNVARANSFPSPAQIVFNNTSGPAQNFTVTDTAPDHSHTVQQPSHQHTLTMPNHSHTVPAPAAHGHDITPDHNHEKTQIPPHIHVASFTVDNFVGSATPFSVVNSNVKLIAWHRTA